MATVKKGMLTQSPQWWRHLRFWKRVFWKRERATAKRLIDDNPSFDPSKPWGSDRRPRSQGLDARTPIS
jgi:hypothetical protein